MITNMCFAPTAVGSPFSRSWRGFAEFAKALCLIALGVGTAAAAGDVPGIRVAGALDLRDIRGDQVFLELSATDGQGLVTLDYSDAPLDLSQFRDAVVEIENRDDARLDIGIKVISDRSMDWKYSAEGRSLVEPHSRQMLNVVMYRAPLEDGHALSEKYGDLFAFEGGFQRNWRYVQADRISQVRLVLSWREAEAGARIALTAPSGAVDFTLEDVAGRLADGPLIDRFGQLNYGEWPDKVANDAELQADGQADLRFASGADLPAGRSVYGGWAEGPQLEATGFFRVARHQERWTLVDPDGHLFWSIGVTGVGQGSDTPTKGREVLFEEPNAEMIRFYWDNLEAKYGAGKWKPRHVQVALARMRDWGLNTIGAWSMPEMMEARRVPYTLIVHTALQGFGPIKKIPDPYSSRFLDSLDAGLAQLAEEHAGDSWLIGVFVHNELHWENGTTLVEGVLAASPETPARLACVAFLKERYGDLPALNEAWGSAYESFAEIGKGGDTYGNPQCRQDLEAFLGRFADTYFAACHDAVQRHFPNHLYLGCRFHQLNPAVTRAASRYCDVISTNLYRYSVANFSLQADEDRPWLISEFHFGVREKGVWGAGLTAAGSAQNQADLYGLYLNDALRHPNFVGAHWFQWSDQPVTGRPDGENFRVGVVTIVDRPNLPLVEAIGTVSSEMYERRFAE